MKRMPSRQWMEADWRVGVVVGLFACGWGESWPEQFPANPWDVRGRQALTIIVPKPFPIRRDPASIYWNRSFSPVNHPIICSRSLAALAGISLISPAFAVVHIDYVSVGNAGNAADPATGSLYCAVSYAYKIGKYEVTNAQYGEFLNAKGASNSNGTYSLMDATTGIIMVNPRSKVRLPAETRIMTTAWPIPRTWARMRTMRASMGPSIRAKMCGNGTMLLFPARRACCVGEPGSATTPAWPTLRSGFFLIMKSSSSSRR